MQIFNKKWLLDKTIYREVIAALVQKVKKEPRKLHTQNKVDDISFESLVLDQELTIKKIINEIQRSDFVLSPFKLLRIPKGDGKKFRNIFVPSWPDRVLLSVVARVFHRETLKYISKDVYSFQKGKSHVAALTSFKTYLESKTGKPVWVLKRDISSYGDSISHEQLLRLLKRDIDYSSQAHFEEIIKKALKIEFYENGHEKIGTCLIRGIASGSPLCPPVENYYLHELDSELANIEGSFYARYGDDFIFAQDDYHKVQLAARIIKAKVAELQLEIKDEKAKNILLLKSAIKEQVPPGWERCLSFEHLGRRINYLGKIGPKQATILRIHQTIKNDIKQIIKTLGQFSLCPEDRVACLRVAIQRWFEAEAQNDLAPIIFENDIEQICKNVDAHKTKWIISALRRYWGLSPREAWRVFRKLKVFSVTRKYQMRRMSRRKNKFNAKRVA